MWKRGKEKEKKELQNKGKKLNKYSKNKRNYPKQNDPPCTHKAEDEAIK